MSQKAKILLFDIETSPNIGMSWGGKWEVNILHFIKEWQIISIAWKWLGEKVNSLTLHESGTEKKLCSTLHGILAQSDVVIAHNGDSFDLKKANARFLFHKLPPLKPVISIDTKKVAKKYFSFNSNSLDDLGIHLGVGRKVKDEGIDMWLRCMNGDKSAWKKMKEYNEQDVVLLEKVYEKLKPWIQNHPNISLINNKEGCPNCGHSEFLSNGIRYTQTRKYRRLTCKSCFAHFKGALVK